MPRYLGLGKGGTASSCKLLLPLNIKLGATTPRPEALLEEGWAGMTYPNLQGYRTALWPLQRSRPEESWDGRKSVSLGSASPERLKIFPAAGAKFICQSSKELIPASVWKCQPVWLEECGESFPLNSREHMGGGWHPPPQLANSRSSKS